jgi:hypothetical protein
VDQGCKEREVERFSVKIIFFLVLQIRMKKGERQGGKMKNFSLKLHLDFAL